MEIATSMILRLRESFSGLVGSGSMAARTRRCRSPASGRTTQIAHGHSRIRCLVVLSTTPAPRLPPPSVITRSCSERWTFRTSSTKGLPTASSVSVSTPRPRATAARRVSDRRRSLRTRASLPGGRTSRNSSGSRTTSMSVSLAWIALARLIARSRVRFGTGPSSRPKKRRMLRKRSQPPGVRSSAPAACPPVGGGGGRVQPRPVGSGRRSGPVVPRALDTCFCSAEALSSQAASNLRTLLTHPVWAAFSPQSTLLS